MAGRADKESRRVFTLRFRNPRTYEMLRLAARYRKVSMNELAEEAVEEHLSVEALFLEEQLTRALEAVRSFTRGDLEQDVAAFAHAEVAETDPLRATGIPPAADADDPFGVGEAFVRPVE